MGRTNYLLVLVIMVVVLVAGIVVMKLDQHPALHSSPVSNSSLSSAVLGVQTKTSGCQALNGLPDKGCTPGAVISGVTKDQVCTSGWAKSVRNVTSGEKDQVFSEYGIISYQSGEYEVDHLISLELGGSNDLANLWPESSEPKPGFHEKDRVENYLHNQVCNGAITLQEAQQKISTNWLEVYQTSLNRKSSIE